MCPAGHKHHHSGHQSGMQCSDEESTLRPGSQKNADHRIQRGFRYNPKQLGLDSPVRYFPRKGSPLQRSLHPQPSQCHEAKEASEHSSIVIGTTQAY
mmetsp:Transcript_10269/g.25751  ORF Transcript_10269/g.25751 Transcript_10269/m.25751 type:complete len:97 (-) Transcript_10269:358-648(-)